MEYFFGVLRKVGMVCRFIRFTTCGILFYLYFCVVCLFFVMSVKNSVPVKKDAKGKKKKGVVIKLDRNSNVIESIIFSTAQARGDIYRQRFLSYLILQAQNYIKSNLSSVNSSARLEVDMPTELLAFEVPSRYLLDSENDKNYAKAKGAIIDYTDWKLVYEDKEIVYVTNVLMSAKFDKYRHTFTVELRKDVWNMLLDFRRGYTEYDAEVLRKLRSPFARVIYKRLPNMKGPLTYTFDSFREKFGYKEKYPRPSDLVRRVIEPAKRELDKVSNWTFEYEIERAYASGCNVGAKPLSRIVFRAVRKVVNDSEVDLMKSLSPYLLLGQEVTKVLSEKLDFRQSEIMANIQLFHECVNRMGMAEFADWLVKLVPWAARANKSVQGYVVNATRKMLKEKYQVVMKSVSEKVQVNDLSSARTVDAVKVEPVGSPSQSVPFVRDEVEKVEGNPVGRILEQGSLFDILS